LRIAVVLPHLGPGGAQKVSRVLIEKWTKVGAHVTVLVTFREADKPVAMPECVPVLYYADAKSSKRNDPGPTISNGSSRVKTPARRPPFGTYSWYLQVVAPIMPGFVNRAAHGFNQHARFAFNLVRRIVLLRKTLRRIKPDVVVSFLSLTNVMTIIAASDLKTAVVVNERNAVLRQRQALYVRVLRKLTYPAAQQLWTNTVENLAVFRARKRRPVIITPNPLELPPRHQRGIEEFEFGQAPQLLYVGRLVAQKNIAFLLRSFALLRESFPDAQLDILGDGDQRDYLQRLAEELGLRAAAGGRVAFHGWVDPTAWLAEARVFVHTSKYEGTPNALLEAMSYALPAVVTRATLAGMGCEPACAGVVCADKDTPEAMAAALRSVCEDAERLQLLGSEGRAYVEQFEATEVSSELLERLKAAVHTKRNGRTFAGGYADDVRFKATQS